MVPASSDKDRFIAYGRVFSGTARSGSKLRIMGPNYVPGNNASVHIQTIRSTFVMMGRRQDGVGSVPCGNTLGLSEIDHFMIKSGNISDHPEAFPLKDMQYSVSPVVRVADEPKHPVDIPKLIEGLKRLAKSDPLIFTTTEPTGETSSPVQASCASRYA
jgi:elongation factor 2